MPPNTANPPIQTKTPPPKRPPTTFSSLPPELRDKIYAHLFIDVACGPNKLSTLCRTSRDEENDTVEQIFAVSSTWLEKSRIAYEMCVALYRHCTFRHGDLVTDLGNLLRLTVRDVLLPSPKEGMKSCHPRGEQQQRSQQQFTNGAFLANISITISLSSERDRGASYVLYQLFRCPRLRNLFVELKMSASAVGAYDGDGRKWASPLSEIAHACERLQKAAGERLRLVVYVDEAFWGQHVLDGFDRRGVSWCMGGEERRGSESLRDEWSQRMALTNDVRMRQGQDPKLERLKISGW